VPGPGVSDNCASFTITNNFNNTSDASGNYPIGVTTVLWTATDGSSNTATCTQNVTVLAPEINVQGGGQNIADGATAGTATTTNDRDFGTTTVSTPVSHTFTIQNTGTSNLAISNIVASGGDAAMFTVSALSPASPIAPNSSATFNVTFNPTSAGAKSTTIIVSNDDCNESSYDFVVIGTGSSSSCPVPSFTSCPSQNVTGTTSSTSCDAVVSYTATASNAQSYTYTLNGGSPLSGPGSGSTFPKGTTAVVVTATNSCGSATCSFNVVVSDNVPPSITAPGNATFNGWCLVPVSAIGLPTVSDNCASTTTLNANISNDAPAGGIPVGTTTVVWTVQDGNGNSAQASQIITVNPPSVPVSVTAAVSPLYPMAGQETQTIYLNYPSSAQADTIKGTASGGTGVYSYSWKKSNCNGSIMDTLFSSGVPVTTSKYTFAPSNADTCSYFGDNVYTFTVKATDNHGCNASISKKLNVVNVWTGSAGSSNVQLCHKVPRSSLTQIIQVSPSLVSSHLGHGDLMGNCPVFIGRQVLAETEEEEYAAYIYPNPTTGIFVLELSEVKTEAFITITDMSGKLIAQRILRKDVAPTVTFDMSEVAKGVYMIQVKDGELVYRDKVVIY
jgi:hypothetical protein